MVAVLLLNNAYWWLRLRLGVIRSFSFGMHHSLSVDDSVRYIEDVFSDYKQYGGIEHFWGDVAEVGPGDSAGVALLIRGDGAAQVDLVDQFASVSDPAQQALIYEELSRRHQISGLIDSGTAGARSEISGIRWHLGVPAEVYFDRCVRDGRRYDAIVSRAVLEHLYDPIAAVRSMAAALRPGGVMIHKIDLRDHGLFSLHHHKLTWLRFPAWLWGAMTRYSGHPNRVLVDQYREVMDELAGGGAVEFRLLVSQLVGAGEIEPHLPTDHVPADALRAAEAQVRTIHNRLAPAYRTMHSDDLAISGVFLVARRLEP